MADHNSLPLPLIDVSPFNGREASSEAQRAAVAEELARACATHGAFYFKSGEIGKLTENARLKVFNAAQEFFALPDDVKNKIPIRAGGFTRGYIPIGGESGSQAVEVKEAFSYGYPWPSTRTPENSLQGPNEWPDARAVSPNWQKTLEEFYAGMVQVAEAVTRALSVALGMDAEYFPSFCKEGDTISLMRLFHYFPYEKADGSGLAAAGARIGSSAHTDWGFLTLVLQQEGVTGLQVADTNGEWIDVPPVAGTFIVNAGDYLSLMTRGRVKSPLHRVVTSDKERLSLVFFYYPTYEAKIPMMEKDSETASRISLFVNQSKSTTAAEQQTLSSAETIGSFGEYIANKWSQVFRDPAGYKA
ncbi:hypothetical protein DFJ77DRAFT_447739 [Powellomyces hirtus]|nr:hypothetical protein DFJ77DRAFT_447739 [Powellomyces hirtus]